MLVFKKGEVEMKEHQTVGNDMATWVSIKLEEDIPTILKHVDDLLLCNKTNMELLIITENDWFAVTLVRRLG